MPPFSSLADCPFSRLFVFCYPARRSCHESWSLHSNPGACRSEPVCVAEPLSVSPALLNATVCLRLRASIAATRKCHLFSISTNNFSLVTRKIVKPPNLASRGVRPSPYYSSHREIRATSVKLSVSNRVTMYRRHDCQLSCHRGGEGFRHGEEKDRCDAQHVVVGLGRVSTCS